MATSYNWNQNIKKITEKYSSDKSSKILINEFDEQKLPQKIAITLNNNPIVITKIYSEK